ncbi:MAG: HAD-IB family hydrolase [Caulobacteraceae bacterium]
MVAFDFDGTLTCRDSFRDDLRWRSGWRRYVAGLLALTPAAFAYLRRRDRGSLKAAMVHRFLRGETRAGIEALATRYARVRSRGLLRPDALRCWRDWRGRGACLVIVTATPEIIVAPFARGLGADLLIGTRLVCDADDRVTGALDGLNCRGEEKVRRLRERFGDDLILEAAYGDSDGDTAMLAIAGEAGLRVFGARP